MLCKPFGDGGSDDGSADEVPVVEVRERPGVGAEVRGELCPALGGEFVPVDHQRRAAESVRAAACMATRPPILQPHSTNGEGTVEHASTTARA